MIPSGERGRIAAGAMALVTTLVVTYVLASRAARPKPEPCPDGRYLVGESPLLGGVATTPGDGITVTGDQITLDGPCPPVPGKVKAKRRGTNVRAKWPLCDGVEGPVRLKGKIEPACQTFTGRLVAKKERVKESFTAIRSTCGDGTIDPLIGEECDTGQGCTPPATCTEDCDCLDPQSSTTTTIGGGSTTSTTAAPSTSTTSTSSSSSTSTSVGGSSTTSTSLPTVPGPDPSTVAPPLDPSAVTGFAGRTAFLFGGPSPVQFNVAAGAIDAARAAVVRGVVLDGEGDPLSAVLVRILGHPEFGQTLSRSDGGFDMAVNGGGFLTLAYEKTGFLPAQRQVTVPWQDYAPAPDVRLVPVDAQATAVDLTTATEIVVARGSAQSDADGTRQATLLVEPGTTAEMVLPDGSTQPLPQITLRATEFTVGDAGPETMPAALPAQSGYTYAVEFSVDEAMAAGASMVRFDRPIPTYVENFTGFPVGMPVPAGYYDKTRGAWVAAPNGRVIGIVGETGGLADLDVTGDGVADTGAPLIALGIDDAERETIATLYAPGQSLWRVPVDHFSPWDYNVAAGAPGDAVSPGGGGASASSEDEPIDGSCQESGSVLECENQVLGEIVPIAGTAYELHYRSDRVPGRLDSLDVQLSGPSLPASLEGIRLRASIGGQTIDQTFPPVPDQSTTITWDGRDAYGRPLQGGQKITGQIDYLYPVVFKAPNELGQVFGSIGGPSVAGNRTTSTFVVPMQFAAVLREGITDARGLGLGGWTLGVHHFYDPATQVLHLGSGERRRATSLARVVDAFVPATSAFVTKPVAGRDGSLYTALFGDGAAIRRRAPNGTNSTVAGGGFSLTPPFGEGGPAVGATLISSTEFTFGPDESLYIGEEKAVLRVGADGIIRRVLGRERLNTPTRFCPGSPYPAAAEGAIATEIDLCMRGLAVGPDSSIYFIEVAAGRQPVVRRVGTDGRISTVAGTGQACSTAGCGDGGPALAATFADNNPFSLAAAPDGSLYFPEDRSVIRRIGPDGIMTTVAGSRGQRGFAGDGGLAVDARLCDPAHITFDPDGSLLFVDQGNKRIRRIATDGRISTVAGTTSTGASCDNTATSPSGNGGPALRAGLGTVIGLTVGPNGEIFLMDSALVGGSFVRAIRRIALPLPSFSASDVLVASEDGRSLYAFDPTGRHLATLDALTGAVRREFDYDTEGRLTTVTERTGGTDNVTTIERDAAGLPTGIVGPFGKRTTLTTDANGFLSAITNAANETIALASTADGLLTSFTTPGSHTSVFTYDANGRLVRHEDAADGSQDLERTGDATDFTLTRTTALGRATTYRVETLPERVTRRTVTGPDGTQGGVVETLDAATREFTAPDGTETTVVAGGDPRFDLQSPVATSVSTRLPSGLTVAATNTRTATLLNANDPLSLVTLGESSSVAGNTWATTYTASTRTFLTTSPLGRTRTLALDALGRAASLQASGGLPTVTTYDARGRIATITTGDAPDTRSFTFTYDAQGLAATVTDPLDRTVTMERDAVGRLTRKTLPGGDVIDVTFNASGELVGITPPGRPAHTFAYGPRGELVEVTPPAVAGTGPTTFAYDDDGNLTTVTRPNETLTFTYDATGHLETLALDVAGGAQGTYTVAYDAATGLVSGASGPGGTSVAYAYDGSLVTGVTWSGPVAGDVTVTHDNRLAVATESVNGGSTVTFVHDADDRLVAAGDLAIARDATTGLPATTTLGVVSDTWTHDGFGELVDYEATANGTPIYAESFERDGLGRITRKVETIGGDTDTIDYAYDSKGQLAEVTRDGSVVERYTYDPNGNRTAATVGGTSVTATYDDQDRLLTYGGATFTHTPSGRLATRTAGGTTTYEYDAAGNLLAVTLPGGAEVTYLLDPGFHRIARDVDGSAAERFLWSGGRPLAQLDGAGAVVARFVYAGGLAPVYVVRDGAAHRLITDHAGSVRLVVNTTTGAVVQRLDYDSFGRVTQDTSPGFQPFGFAGGLYDPATQLVRFGARDYDAATGRWTARDPSGFNGLDTNLYRYAANDPVNLVDPEGLTAADIAAGIVAGLVDAAQFAVNPMQGILTATTNIANAISGALGYPVPAPPDPNPVVGIMEVSNDIAALFDSEPIVDTGGLAFAVSRFCAGVVADLGAGAIAGAGRGVATASARGGIRPAMKPAQKAVARTADPNYRPFASAEAARAERLAAENAAREQSRLQKAKEAIGRWLQNLGFSGGKTPTRGGWTPGSGA